MAPRRHARRAGALAAPTGPRDATPAQQPWAAKTAGARRAPCGSVVGRSGAAMATVTERTAAPACGASARRSQGTDLTHPYNQMREVCTATLSPRRAAPRHASCHRAASAARRRRPRRRAGRRRLTFAWRPGCTAAARSARLAASFGAATIATEDSRTGAIGADGSGKWLKKSGPRLATCARSCHAAALRRRAPRAARCGGACHFCSAPRMTARRAPRPKSSGARRSLTRCAVSPPTAPRLSTCLATRHARLVVAPSSRRLLRLFAAPCAPPRSAARAPRRRCCPCSALRRWRTT